MSKIIAIDFGLKRTGLAITDDSRTFAFKKRNPEWQPGKKNHLSKG